jgi:riboflavin synthase
MFTGIIQHIGTVKEWKGDRLILQTPFTRAKKGESIALDGVCLTVVSIRGKLLGFDVTEETRRKTTLGGWKPGSKVNLERAMRLGDAVGGHMVQGHVEGVGRLIGRTPEPAGILYRFQGYAGLGRFLASKGSVAVDGISLTVVDPAGDDFSVAIIPHTEVETTLGLKKIGDPVNLESDIIARQVSVYLEKMK